jgi:hypothetical protein
MPEAIAFIYKVDVLEPELLPNSISLVENIEIDGRDLVRTQWEAGDFDFTLIAAHLAWGNEDDRDDGYQKINEIFHTETPSQFSGDDDIIVLGDFNRFGGGFDSVKELDHDPNVFLAPNITIFDPNFNSLQNVTATSIAGKGIPGDNPQLLSTTVAQNRKVYDMIMISADVAEEFPPGSTGAVYGVDFGIIHFDEPTGFGHHAGAENLGHNDLKAAYSDHRPLWIRFHAEAETADDGPGGVDLTPPTASATYVGTEHGSRFHRPHCHTIRDRNLTKNWTSRAEALSTRLPCKVCKP